MHSASGITADASISGIGDSTDQGEEKSAVKNTDPDSRTTRRTSDNTSMCDLVRRADRCGARPPGLAVKDSRGSLKRSSESGVPGKRRGAPVIELRRPPVQDDRGATKHWIRSRTMPLLTPDPTFYPSPAMATQAPPETLGYVALVNPREGGSDALGVVDLDPVSKSYGRLVGQTDMPHAGDELHHFGWNACSSCLCPYAPHPHMERRYLVVPGIHSSRIHILDTKPDPRQ